MMESLFAPLTREDLKDDPFPHLVRTGCLSEPYYAHLARTFIDYGMATQGQAPRNNYAFNIPGLLALDTPVIDPEWKAFIAYHHSQAAYAEVIALFGDHIRRLYPDLETRVGKKLENFVTAPRPFERTVPRGGVDVLLDCQFTYNTPVTRVSRVRGIHVDKSRRLYSGLFYMRPEWDDTVGGDLDVFRFRNGRRFTQTVAVPDDAAELVDRVPYQANSLMLFVNSPDSLHGVTERHVTPYPRRYINILAELRDPLFDLGPYQET